MKTKIILYVFAWVVMASVGLSVTQAQTSTCKCGPNCKCGTDQSTKCKCGPGCVCKSMTTCKCCPDCKCRIEHNGVCKCGPNCTCAQTSTICKCGPGCKCKEGDKSACKCGPNCQCHAHHGAGHMHSTSQNEFLKMMDVMMAKMDSVPLNSSVERNFLVQMIPHHQGALEMARYEIEHGKDFEMIQLAKSILAEQKGEIMEMQAMMKSYPAVGTVSPAYKTAMDKTMMVMMDKTPGDSTLTGSVDCNFAMVMLPHHQAAVDMAVALLNLDPKGQVVIYAQRIIADQQIEIEQMEGYIKNNCKK